MINRRNYYRILHVDRDAPLAVIQASYRTLMGRLGVHPDLGGEAVEAALVNEAYAVLSDPAQRAAYDLTILEVSAWRRASTARRPAAVSRRSPPPNAPVCGFCAAPCAASDSTRRDGTCTTCGSPLYPAPTPDSGDRSRRAMERLARDLPVTFRRAQSPKTLWRGTTKDLSVKGMRLLSPVRLSIDERLRIDNDFCSAVAVVRSVSSNPVSPLGGWVHGIEFLTLRRAHDQGGLVSTVA